MGLNKRIGKIEIESGILQEMGVDILSSLFSEFYPLWIDSTTEGIMEYHGMSEHFREIEYGDEIPTYEANIEIGEDLIWTKFIEVESVR